MGKILGRPNSELHNMVLEINKEGGQEIKPQIILLIN
jgi:hypothetical protein